jgi:hypothetical protein
MAADDSWASIRRHGLLSTSALLDLFEIVGEQREALETRHRPKSISIQHPIHGTALIRDQKPMTDESVRRALADTGLTPSDWYQLLNRRVFFWTTEERLQRMLGAAPYRDLHHTVLTVDTQELLHRHGSRVTLSPINSGATRPYPWPRSTGIFQPPATFPYARYRKSRRSDGVIVELAVDRAVEDVAELVIDVRRVRHGETRHSVPPSSARNE